MCSVDIWKILFWKSNDLEKKYNSITQRGVLLASGCEFHLVWFLYLEFYVVVLVF